MVKSFSLGFGKEGKTREHLKRGGNKKKKRKRHILSVKISMKVSLKISSWLADV